MYKPLNFLLFISKVDFNYNLENNDAKESGTSSCINHKLLRFGSVVIKHS